jgi:hypothetical protein
MRIRGWIGAALLVGLVLGITGCTGLSQSRVREVLASIGKTPGVIRETHVDDSAAGYCEQTCYQGAATLVVGTKLSKDRVLAIRDRIAGTLDADHIDGFAMSLTLQQGPDHITLGATHAQYAAWTRLRHIEGVHAVDMDASAWILAVTKRATIEVNANSRSSVIAVLTKSAAEVISSGVFGKRVFLTSRTPDGRYYVAVDPHTSPLPYLVLDRQILTDPALTGGSVDKSPLGGYGIVGLRVASLGALPDTYLRYDGIVTAYSGLYVHTVDYPGGTVSIFGHMGATDPAMVALRDVIATGARVSGFQIQEVAGRPTSFSCDVPTDADAAQVNSVILAHPELHALGYFRVTSHADRGGTSVWDFGVASN